jgi:hypothetical protein
VWFGRRGAGAKLAIRSAGDGGKRAVLREEHEVSRKAIAQGRPECSRCPVCSCAVLFAQIARETAGAASTRSSLRPLSFERVKIETNLGRNAPRDRETISTSLRAQRSNPSLRLPRYGLLRCARNDGERVGSPPSRIHWAAEQVVKWIPGLRQEARPQVRNCAPGNDERTGEAAERPPRRRGTPPGPYSGMEPGFRAP